MFLLTKQKVKFLCLCTFALSRCLAGPVSLISPVSCKFRDLEDAVDGVRAVDEPRDRRGEGLSLGPLAVAGPAGRRRRHRVPEEDENDGGGEDLRFQRQDLHFNGRKNPKCYVYFPFPIKTGIKNSNYSNKVARAENSNLALHSTTM